MLVMKFGGTSVGAVEQIRTAARIVESAVPSGPIVILSAMAGVTDGLLTAGQAAVQGLTRDRDDKLWEIRSKHDRAINELFKERRVAAEVQETLRPLWEEMQKVFTGVSLLREMSARSRDLIGSFGERLIVPLFTRYLKHWVCRRKRSMRASSSSRAMKRSSCSSTLTRRGNVAGACRS